MINTNLEYDKAIADERVMYVQDDITFPSGSTRTLENADVMSYSIQDATSSDNNFEIGAAIAKKYTITLDNADRRYDRVVFGGSRIDAKIGVQLSASVITIRKGIFYVTKATKRGKTYVLEAYDGMVKFNRPYSESKLEFPATVNEIISNACLECGMTFNARTVIHGNYVIERRPADESITFRDIISFCAQLMGRYAKVDTEDVLFFGWYDFDAFTTGVTGAGWFDEDNPYSSGANLDGGTFRPWNDGEYYDAGTFSHMKESHHFIRMKSEQINQEDVVVTGIKVASEDGDDSFQYGDNGYVLEVSQNPLIEKGSAEEVATYLGRLLIGCRMRPMSISVQSNPAIEAGDVAFVTDRLGDTYQALITSTTFSFGNAQSVICGAETKEEQEIEGYSALTKAIIYARRNTQRELSDYDKTVTLMTQLISQGFGMYFIKQEQLDGSYLFYLSDQPTLEESSYTCYATSNGIMASVDGGTTWAIDKNGNALFNVLSVVGFYFDWAKGGTLSLGQYNNQDGVIIVRDASGNIIGRWDRNGIYAKNGTFSGKLEGATGTFSGSLSAATGTFSGELRAATGSFAGALSAATGTFKGSLSAAGGTFNGALESKTSDGKSSVHINGANIYFRTQTGPSQSEMNQQYAYIRPEGYSVYDDGLIEDVNPPALVIRSNYDLKLNCAGTTVLHARYNQTPKLYIPGYATTGSKSRLVENTRYGDLLQYCYETPTPYFGDIGTGRTDEKGECVIAIDALFLETITLGVEYSVFLQKEGKGDLWVDEKNSDYFVIKGTPDLKFSWELKAVQRDFSMLRLDDDAVTGGEVENAFDVEELFRAELMSYDEEMEVMYGESIKSVSND